MSAAPIAELIGRVSRASACAAAPPNRALAWGVFQARASVVAGVAAARPNRASRIGWRGRWRTGRSRSSFRRSNDVAGAPNTRRQPGPSSPSPATVSSIDFDMTPALPSWSGWARSTSGQAHSSPYLSSSSELRNGDPTAIGCTAEQWSCRSPGTVSSLERVPPPIVSSASSTVTSTPSLASATAQASPLGPAPTTVAVLMWSRRRPRCVSLSRPQRGTPRSRRATGPA